MRKLLLMTTVVIILSLGTAGLAFANGGPHGDYSATTDACAGCHRAHTAAGPNLLIAASTYDLCITCHGSAGSGANTNVDDGFYLSTRDDSGPDYDHGAANTPDNAPLLGGGFVNYGGVAVTSIHDAAETTDAAWGNGVARGLTGALADGNLSCASCHDPHGSSNYRIILETVNGTAIAVAQVDEGDANKDYDTEQWDDTGLNDFCGACHGAYHVTRAGSGTDNTDDLAGNLDYGGDISTFAHRMGMSYSYGANVNPQTVGMGGFFLPLADDTAGPADDLVVCTTCHLPHGTAAQMTGFADGGPDGTGTVPGDTTATDSSLLRLDNRGVCEVCHQK